MIRAMDYIPSHRYMGMPAIDELSTYDRRDTGDYLELASRLERNIQDVIAACDYVKGRKHSDKTMYISLDEYNAVDIGPEADDFLKECVSVGSRTMHKENRNFHADNTFVWPWYACNFASYGIGSGLPVSLF